MGAHFVNDVQTVISRQKDPQKFGVVTVGSFNSGCAQHHPRYRGAETVAAFV
jgi:metal-dependent amidase/aminoacylase/carboxypeptidase family protein